MAAKSKGLKVPKSVQKNIAKNVKKGRKLGTLDGQDIHAVVGAGNGYPPSEGTGVGDGCKADLNAEVAAGRMTVEEAIQKADSFGTFAEVAARGATVALAPASLEPQALTLPLLTDSATLFIQGVQQLTAQLLGQPECAPLLVSINGWLKSLESVKKLIVGNDDAIEGLKKLVIETGQPWGERGSKQLTLAGARVPVKAINWRDPNAPLAIADLDAAKVEAYLRGNAVDPEKTLAGYMKMTPTWGLKDLSPTQQTNLTKMLNDPGEWGQGLRQCLKDTRYVMQSPEMENSP